jgi:hypothetical protein
MNIIQRGITWLFFRFCYQKSEMAMYMICYYVPNTMKKLDGSKLDGQFLFAQMEASINRGVKLSPLVDVPTGGDK